MSAFVGVARVGEIPPGGRKIVRLDDREVAVFHLDDGYYAIEDVCTHDGGPVAEGLLEGDVIECPRHGARFHVKSGAALSLPATSPVPTYRVRVEGDEIQVECEGASPGAGAAFEADRGPRPEDPASGHLSPPPAGPTAAAGGSPGAAGATLSPQEIAVRAACETVMDPEIGLSVIDLGLIREVRFLEGPRTLVRMMLTTPFCPYAPQLVAEVKQAAESAVPQPCEVEILPDAWSPDLMPDPGLLGFSF